MHPLHTQCAPPCIPQDGHGSEQFSIQTVKQPPGAAPSPAATTAPGAGMRAPKLREKSTSGAGAESSSDDDTDDDTAAGSVATGNNHRKPLMKKKTRLDKVRESRVWGGGSRCLEVVQRF